MTDLSHVRADGSAHMVDVSGKEVTAWGLAGDLDPESVRSNTFTMQWPPRSGRQAEFPEIDRAGWFGADAAREKLVPAQVELLERLLQLV